MNSFDTLVESILTDNTNEVKKIEKNIKSLEKDAAKLEKELKKATGDQEIIVKNKIREINRSIGELKSDIILLGVEDDSDYEEKAHKAFYRTNVYKGNKNE